METEQEKQTRYNKLREQIQELKLEEDEIVREIIKLEKEFSK